MERKASHIPGIQYPKRKNTRKISIKDPNQSKVARSQSKVARICAQALPGRIEETVKVDFDVIFRFSSNTVYQVYYIQYIHTNSGYSIVQSERRKQELEEKKNTGMKMVTKIKNTVVVCSINTHTQLMVLYIIYIHVFILILHLVHSGSGRKNLAKPRRGHSS